MVKSLDAEIQEFLNKKLRFQNANKFEASLQAYYFEKHHFERLVHASQKVLPYIKPHDRVVDLGSDGIFPYLVTNMVSDVDAVGITKASYNIIFTEDGHAHTQKVLWHKHSPGKKTMMNLYKCDLNKKRLPFEDNSVDVVTCFEVLEHLYSDPMHLMLEAKRILKKPNGMFFLSTPNISCQKALKRMLNLESPYFWPPYCVTDKEIGHTKEYAVNELKLLFEKSGFSILDIETFNHAETDTFSHDRMYQAGNVLGVKKITEQPQFDERLHDFLGSVGWDSRYQGDYILITSKWKTDDCERYYFPLYESY